MDQFVQVPYSVYQSQSTLQKTPNLEQKKEKEELYQKTPILFTVLKLQVWKQVRKSSFWFSFDFAQN